MLKLFEEISIGKLRVKNRIAMAPMGIGGLCNPDGTYTQRVINYYTERAKGGVGLIITGVTKVDNEIEKHSITTRAIIPLNPMRFVQMAKELTKEVHRFGAKIFIQLTAGFGRVANPKVLITNPIAPSPVHNYWDPSVICRELKVEEIKRLIKAFSKATEVVLASEFDGIEVHALHEGYLLDQFAISLWNKRSDEYGGELSNRLRLAIDILHAIKDVAGKEFPVQMRFSVKSYIKDDFKGGLPCEKFKERGRDIGEGIEAAKVLEKEGYDALNVDAGSYEAWYWSHPPIYMHHGCYLEFSKELKKVIRIPILVAGKMDIPELAERALKEGKADIIALGRPLLADPYWPIKVKEGKIDDIRPCIGCHRGCLERVMEGKPISCAVNPTVGKEGFKSKPLREAKRIVVIGGGVAGMEAARLLAMKGHNVTLYERNNSLGGHLIEASTPEFKRDIGRLLNWYKVQLNKLKVRIILNTEADANIVEKEKPDAVIIATGSEPMIPEGMDKKLAVTCVDLLSGKKEAGNKVVIIGGGLVGCETALWLTKKGRDVTIIESLPEVLLTRPPIPHPNRVMLMNMLKFNKVKVITNAKLKEIRSGSVIIMDKDLNFKEIMCDTIALAMGMKPRNTLYESLKGKALDLYIVGDCREPGNILSAIWDAYNVANSI